MQRFLVFASLLLSLLSGALGASPLPQPIRVLVIDGFSNHNWQLTTQSIRNILDPTHLFAVDVSTAPPDAAAAGWDSWRPRFDEYDVVIQTCNDINGGPSWPIAVRNEFEKFVRRGGGVFVWHAGNNAFEDWPAYNEMIGLGWRKKEFGFALTVDDSGRVVRIPAGEGLDTGHGARLDALISRIGEHEIHVGLPRMWRATDTEVYFYARGPAKNIEVLSYARDPKTGLNWPTEWVTRWGEGRIYTSTFGHVWKGDVDPLSMRDAGVQTLLVRALQWLAKRPVSAVVPLDFPKDQRSVRPPLNSEQSVGH